MNNKVLRSIFIMTFSAVFAFSSLDAAVVFAEETEEIGDDEEWDDEDWDEEEEEEELAPGATMVKKSIKYKVIKGIVPEEAYVEEDEEFLEDEEAEEGYEDESEESEDVYLEASVTKVANGITTANIPSYVSFGEYDLDVTFIENNAFAGKKKLQKLTIPATVYKIGNGAFKKCVSLRRVKIPEGTALIGSQAFSGCTKLSEVEIGKSVTTIGKGTFSKCSSLKKIVIKSEKIKNFGKKTFKGVPSSCVIKVPAKKKTAYAKLLKKAGFKGKVK